MKVIGIQRAERFSPNSVDKDKAILSAVVVPFGGTIIPEDGFKAEQLTDKPDVVFSMARDESTIAQLEKLSDNGIKVINPAQGIMNCRRSTLNKLMTENNIPVPTFDMANGKGWWLKRGDGSAQSKDDVVFCHDDEELKAARQAMESRGITDIIVQPHIEGDLVKFYGVDGTGFFRTYYPGDDRITKFGNEAVNGMPHHYSYDKVHLQDAAELTARITEVPVYGGDAIIMADGSFVIIDFNDWPSFSRCREEAAQAIISLARE